MFESFPNLFFDKSNMNLEIFSRFLNPSNIICLKFDSQTCFRGSSVLSKVNMAIHMWLNT